MSYEVYTSLDGKDRTLSASGDGWENNAEKKTIEFETPVEAQYVKFVATEGVGGFMSAAMLEFYEDASSEETFEMGDVNHDNILSIADVTAVQSYIAGNNAEIDISLADMDKDSLITIGDCTAIQKIIAGMAA